MQAPPSENIRVVRYAEGFGYSAREWAMAFAGVDWLGIDLTKPAAEPLKDGRRGSVWRAGLRLGPRGKQRSVDVVVKVEPLGSPWRRLRALFRSTKAHRQWRGAAMLREAGVSPAEPLAVLRSAEAEALVLAHVSGATLLERMSWGLSRSEETELLDALATMYARLWEARLFLGDGKPSNLLLVEATPGEVGVLDTVGVFKQDQDFLAEREAVVGMLAALYLEPTGCGHRPRRALSARAVWHLSKRAGWTDSDQDTRDLVRSVARAIEAHGDPTPVDDPLAKPPPLRS